MTSDDLKWPKMTSNDPRLLSTKNNPIYPCLKRVSRNPAEIPGFHRLSRPSSATKRARPRSRPMFLESLDPKLQISISRFWKYLGT